MLRDAVRAGGAEPTRMEWWRLCQEAGIPARQRTGFDRGVRALLADGMIHETPAGSAAPRYGPGNGSMGAVANAHRDDATARFVAVLRALCAARGTAVPTEAIQTVLRGQGVSERELAVTILRMRRSTPNTVGVHDVRVHAVVAPGRRRPTLFWQPTGSALSLPPHEESTQTLLRVAIMETEQALGRPVTLEEIRRWAEAHAGSHATAAIVATRVAVGEQLARLRHYFHSRRATTWERAQLEALQSPWAASGTTGARFTLAAHPRLTQSGGARSARHAESSVPSDGVTMEEAIARLSATQAMDLAYALRARDEQPALRQLATSASHRHSTVFRAVTAVRIVALQTLLRQMLQRVRQGAPAFVSVGTADTRGDWSDAQLLACGTTRALSSFAVFDDWLRTIREARRSARMRTSASSSPSAALAQTSSWTLKRAVADVGALVVLHGEVGRYVTDATGRSHETESDGVTVIGAGSGVLLRDTHAASIEATRPYAAGRARTAQQSGFVFRLARRVPVERGPWTRSDPLPYTHALDRVDAIHCVFAQLPVSNASALLASARLLIGEVLRDVRVVEDALRQAPSRDGVGRRAGVVALGLLGSAHPEAHPALDLRDPLDVRAAIVAAVCSRMLPPMGRTPQERSTAWAFDVPLLGRALRALEGRVLDTSTLAAPAHIASHAVMRVRAGRWLEVVD